MAHFNQLNILVNNAGFMPQDNIETVSMQHFEQTMKVNLYSAVLLTHLAVPASDCHQGHGGQRVQCLRDSFQLAPKGIRVNCINPGVIVTPLQRRGGMSDSDYAAFLERSKVTHALGRAGEVDEAAQAIAFLASSASSFITGGLLPVDGGRSAMCPR
ncbi:hypothetical protein AHF37_05643 [Paragonimus kellicotti]|nr:hypothetical protein AHF37_05643 [Paragonimus kellicotti]